MSVTFDDVTEEVTSNLQAYTASPDQVTSLTSAIAPTDLSIVVADASVTSRGIIEIGTELIWVIGSNQSNNTLSILPNGRGWRGTTPVAHNIGDTVVATPAVPRSVVQREINNQILGIYPDLYAVGNTEFTYSNILQIGWGVPANTESILDVRWKDYNGNWQRIRTWETENGADLIDFPTGKTVRFHGIPQGRTVQVIYAQQPSVLVNDTDLFSSTGLDASAKDLIVLGTMARILPNLDVSRLSVQSVAAADMTQNRPPGSAMSVAKYIEAKYQQRLAGERKRLNSLYPARIHFSR